jgi:hypothetical protein
MERRRDEQNPDREMMEHVPQEPITANPTEEGEAKDGAEDDDPRDEGLGRRATGTRPDPSSVERRVQSRIRDLELQCGRTDRDDGQDAS